MEETNKTEEIISKEQIEGINETIDKAAAACSAKAEKESDRIDFEKSQRHSQKP